MSIFRVKSESTRQAQENSLQNKPRLSEVFKNLPKRDHQFFQQAVERLKSLAGSNRHMQSQGTSSAEGTQDSSGAGIDSANSKDNLPKDFPETARLTLQAAWNLIPKEDQKVIYDVSQTNDCAGRSKYYDEGFTKDSPETFLHPQNSEKANDLARKYMLEKNVPLQSVETVTIAVAPNPDNNFSQSEIKILTLTTVLGETFKVVQYKCFACDQDDDGFPSHCVDTPPVSEEWFGENSIYIQDITFENITSERIITTLYENEQTTITYRSPETTIQLNKFKDNGFGQEDESLEEYPGGNTELWLSPLADFDAQAKADNEKRIENNRIAKEKAKAAAEAQKTPQQKAIEASGLAHFEINSLKSLPHFQQLNTALNESLQSEDDLKHSQSISFATIEQASVDIANLKLLFNIPERGEKYGIFPAETDLNPWNDNTEVSAYDVKHKENTQPGWHIEFAVDNSTKRKYTKIVQKDNTSETVFSEYVTRTAPWDASGIVVATSFVKRTPDFELTAAFKVRTNDETFHYEIVANNSTLPFANVFVYDKNKNPLTDMPNTKTVNELLAYLNEYHSLSTEISYKQNLPKPGATAAIAQTSSDDSKILPKKFTEFWNKASTEKQQAIANDNGLSILWETFETLATNSENKRKPEDQKPPEQKSWIYRGQNTIEVGNKTFRVEPDPNNNTRYILTLMDDQNESLADFPYQIAYEFFPKASGLSAYHTCELLSLDSEPIVLSRFIFQDWSIRNTTRIFVFETYEEHPHNPNLLTSTIEVLNASTLKPDSTYRLETTEFPKGEIARFPKAFDADLHGAEYASHSPMFSHYSRLKYKMDVDVAHKKNRSRSDESKWNISMWTRLGIGASFLHLADNDWNYDPLLMGGAHVSPGVAARLQFPINDSFGITADAGVDYSLAFLQNNTEPSSQLMIHNVTPATDIYASFFLNNREFGVGFGYNYEFRLQPNGALWISADQLLENPIYQYNFFPYPTVKAYGKFQKWGVGIDIEPRVGNRMSGGPYVTAFGVSSVGVSVQRELLSN